MTGLMLEHLTRRRDLMLVGLITITTQMPSIGKTSSHVLMRRLIGYMGDGNLSAGSAGQTVIHIVRTAGERPQIFIVRSNGAGGYCVLGMNAMNATPSVTTVLQVRGEVENVLLQRYEMLSECSRQH